MTKLKQLQLLARRHLWHVVSLVALSLGSGSLAVALQLGLGGFEVPALLVAIGLVFALLGATMHHFGETLLNNRLAYLGTSLEGLAWYVWSINGAWLINQNGSHVVLFCLLPGLVFVPLPSIAHYVNTKVLSDVLAARIIHRHAENPVPVLIIEPSRTFGKALTVLLLATGHHVDCFVGVSSLRPLKCIDKDGEEVEIEPSNYGLALVDHQIDGRKLPLVLEQLGSADPSAVLGPTLVSLLSAAGLPCVGISFSAKFNQELKEAGAKCAAPKHLLLFAVVSKTVHLNEFVENGDLSGIESDIADLMKNVRGADRGPASELMHIIGQGEEP
jgi:hypothetical protein